MQPGPLLKHYRPELANFPDKYNYEPWKASAAELKRVRCIIGVDYTKQTLNDLERKEIYLARIKAAYEAVFKEDAPAM